MKNEHTPKLDFDLFSKAIFAHTVISSIAKAAGYTAPTMVQAMEIVNACVEEIKHPTVPKHVLDLREFIIGHLQMADEAQSETAPH